MDSLPATRASWKITPLPEARKRLPVEKSYSAAAYSAIQRGLIPGGSDDRWFMFWEDDWLYLHRSWTGICIFQVKFVQNAAEYRIDEAWVNRDPEQYDQTDDENDKAGLLTLISWLI